MDIPRDLFALAFYFIILLGVLLRFNQRKFSKFLLWTCIFLAGYFFTIEIQNKTFFYFDPALLFFIVLLFLFQRKMSVAKRLAVESFLTQFCGVRNVYHCYFHFFDWDRNP